jgi:hypothetical protein
MITSDVTRVAMVTGHTWVATATIQVETDCKVRAQATETPQHRAQPDGSTLTDEIYAWFALRIKKRLVKQATEWHVNIMTGCLMMGTWPVTYLLQQYICISYGLHQNSVEILSPMFPLSYIGARLSSNWNARTDTELLPHSWNFSTFIVNILIMHITKNC